LIASHAQRRTRSTFFMLTGSDEARSGQWHRRAARALC
jgi:hypothetical protein